MDIKLKDIYKSYGDKTVFENLNHTFKEKKTCFIMGPSGVGKTTLLRLLMGLEKADSGKIEGTEGRKISAVFQDDALIENISVYLNLKLVSDKSDVDEIRESLKSVGLENTEYKRARELSGGMKRRVAILRAVLCQYDILVMDEPFKGMDTALKENIMNFILERTENSTVIIVTHDRSEVEFFRKKGDADILFL